MAARGTMKHRATVERDQAAAGTDEGGNPAEADWQTHLSDLPCRAWFETGREAIDGTKTAVVEDRRMIVPRDTDITERDRIAQVTDRRGEQIFDGPMRIESVGTRQDHLALMLEAV